MEYQFAYFTDYTNCIHFVNLIKVSLVDEAIQYSHLLFDNALSSPLH